MRAVRQFTLPPVYWRRHTGPLPARYAMAAEMRRAAHHNHLLHKLMRERDEALEKIKDLECEIAIRSLGARARIERADAAERQLAEAVALLQRGVEWQEYAERIETKTDEVMANEIQRLRREKPQLERQLGRAKAALQEFVDHYPMGINPWLDAACRNARAILAGETT